MSSHRETNLYRQGRTASYGRDHGRDSYYGHDDRHYEHRRASRDPYDSDGYYSYAGDDEGRLGDRFENHHPPPPPYRHRDPSSSSTHYDSYYHDPDIRSQSRSRSRSSSLHEPSYRPPNSRSASSSSTSSSSRGKEHKSSSSPSRPRDPLQIPHEKGNLEIALVAVTLGLTFAATMVGRGSRGKGV